MREYFLTLERAFPYSLIENMFTPELSGALEARRPDKAAKLLEGDPWEEPIKLLLHTFTGQLKTRMEARLITAYLTGSAQMVEWGRTKTTDRPIFYEGPPMRQAFQYAEAHCARLVTNIDEETERRLAQLISDGIRNKEGVANISRNIRREFTDMSKYRAQMIARTETADALEQAFMDRGHDLGVTGKRWVVTDPCDICMANGNVGTVPIDEAAFYNAGGALILRPPAHPNCRCALAPVMLDEENDG